MGTQTTVSQGITTILLSGSETSGQADCLSISSFYCGRVALAVCWLLSFMVLEKPPSHKFNAMNLRLKAATPSQEKVSHSFLYSWLRNCLPGNSQVWKKRQIESGGAMLGPKEWNFDKMSGVSVEYQTGYPRFFRLDTVGTKLKIWFAFKNHSDCRKTTGLLNSWFVVICLQHFHKRHWDRHAVEQILFRAIREEQIILLWGYLCIHSCT